MATGDITEGSTTTTTTTTSSGTGDGTGAGNGAAPKFTGDEVWKNSLPGDLHEDPSMKAIKTVENLAKSYVSAQKMIGAEKVVKPSKNWGDTEYDQFFNQIGRPESPDKYELKVADGVKTDENFLKQFKEAAHKVGMLPRQAQGLMDWYNAQVTSAVKTQEDNSAAEMQKKMGALESEWGAAFEKKTAAAAAALKKVADESMVKEIKEMGLGKHPTFIKLMSKVAESFGEDKLVGEGGGKFGTTPQEAQRKINAIMSDHNHAYFNKDSAAHKDAVQEMEVLHMAVAAGRR